MGVMPSPKYYEILPPEARSTERPACRLADHESEWFASMQPPDDKPAPRILSRLLITFFLGVVAVLAAQAYVHAARAFVAGLSPQLHWLAPQAAPDKIEQISRSVDRIASDIAASQDQINRSIDHLATGQDQMSRQIIRLEAISRYAPNKESPQQPASGPARKAPRRAEQQR